MKRTSFTLLLFLFIYNGNLLSQVSFDNYANIHTIGISLRTDIPDTQNDLSLSLEYKKADNQEKSSTDNDWVQGFEMVQSNTFDTKLYNSSIFYCSPNTEYFIKVTLIDPTTPSLNGVFYDTIITQTLEAFTTYSKTYYVSPLGTNTLYSESAPGNFQQALNLVQAGERIVLLEGNYNFGEINFNKSGTLTAPITIEGISEGSVFIDGSDTKINWELDGNKGYKSLMSNTNSNVVIANGVRLYPHRTLKELRDHTIAWNSNCLNSGVDGFFRNGTTKVIRLKFRDNSDPKTKDVKVGRYNFFMKLSGSQNIRFSKLDFKYFGSRNEAAIVLKNSSNIRFDACHFKFNDIGVKLDENTNNIIIDNCEFSDGNGDWNLWRMKATYEGVFLFGCSEGEANTDGYRGLEKGGVFVSGNYSGRGMIIKNSSFHDIVQGLSIRPQTFWIDINGKTSEIDFYDNEVYNCSEDGLESDVFARNVRIWNNTFHSTNAAISLASGADGPIYVFRNIFYDFTTDTTWISSWGNYNPGRALKINSGQSGQTIDNTGHLYFMHNTVYAKNDHYPMDLQKPHPQVWDKIILLNNIFHTENQFCMRFRATTFGEVKSDYNNFYNKQKNLIYYKETIFDTLNLPAFSSQFQLDNHSFFAPPSFYDTSNYDFRLNEGSPNIDAGVIIPGLNMYYYGLAPDIGAIESSMATTIPQTEKDIDINLFPNPFSSNIEMNINVNSNFENASLIIYNSDGRVMLHQQIISNNTTINTNKLLPGLYIISIQIDNRTFVKKIIKIS